MGDILAGESIGKHRHVTSWIPEKKKKKQKVKKKKTKKNNKNKKKKKKKKHTQNGDARKKMHTD